MTAAERRLLAVFRKLGEVDRQALQKFAEFLSAAGNDEVVPAPAEPVDIPRPEIESVIKAVKRLSATYPMIDTKELFHETSSLLNQHLLNGQPANEIIDQLEQLFRNQYEKLQNIR